MLKLIFISRSFANFESKLLKKNLERANAIFELVESIYVLNSYEGEHSFEDIPTNTTFIEVNNPKKEKSASLSRLIGYKGVNPKAEDTVLFVDGDMLITTRFLTFLRELIDSQFITCANRADVFLNRPLSQRRILSFPTNRANEFNSLYGCFAIKGINYESYAFLSHDFEEQWLLKNVKSSQARHIYFSELGIIHFDKFVGPERYMRYLISSRGVGIWQGLIESIKAKTFWRDARFVFIANRSLPQALKLLFIATISLPKILIFTRPKKLLYRQITDAS